MFGKMYWYGGKEKITDKIVYLAGVYCKNRLKKIKEVVINRQDAEAEGLSEGDLVGTLRINLSGEVLSDHFWFIEKNNSEIRQKLENKAE
jgi:hypothetical protein